MTLSITTKSRSKTIEPRWAPPMASAQDVVWCVWMCLDAAAWFGIRISRPRIVNTVNSVPVDHVVRVVIAAALSPLPNGVQVVYVTGHPRLRMSEYLSLLEYYGYKVLETTYDDWKIELENYVLAGGAEKDLEQHALMPLHHFCVNDLPANTRASELDDGNAIIKVLNNDAKHWTGIDESAGYGIGREDVGRYLRYLAEMASLAGRTAKVDLSREQLAAAGVVGGLGGPK